MKRQISCKLLTNCYKPITSSSAPDCINASLHNTVIKVYEEVKITMGFVFQPRCEDVGCFLYQAQLDLMYLQMNTKRHRCSRANIICCNYDNTRLVQDVGIRDGEDAFHRFYNNLCFKMREKKQLHTKYSPLLSTHDQNSVLNFLTS